MTKPLESTLRKNLLALAVRYAELADLKLSSVSIYSYGDRHFFPTLAKGGCPSFSLRKYDELVAWFTGNWPKGERMPVLVDPKHQQKRAAHGKKTPTVRSSGKGRKVKSQTKGRSQKGERKKA